MRRETAATNAALGTHHLIPIIRDAVPRWIPAWIADDIRQDLFEVVWSGEVDARALSRSPIAKKIINHNFKWFMSRSNLSLYDAIGEGGERFIENLPADTPLFHHAAVILDTPKNRKKAPPLKDFRSLAVLQTTSPLTSKP
jgi:hypothetical protein